MTLSPAYDQKLDYQFLVLIFDSTLLKWVFIYNPFFKKIFHSRLSTYQGGESLLSKNKYYLKWWLGWWIDEYHIKPYLAVSFVFKNTNP